MEWHNAPYGCFNIKTGLLEAVAKWSGQGWRTVGCASGGLLARGV